MLSTSILNPSSVTDSSPVTSAGRARKVRVELRRSGYAEMRRVEVSIEKDILTLTGAVHSYHMKQMAQEIARQAIPSVVIENRLSVVSSPRRMPK